MITRYAKLSEVYDGIMQDAPYDDWLVYLMKRMPTLSTLNVADVGCGTGRLTVELAKSARTVAGIDLSEEMLMHAMERAGEQHVHVAWLCQDMRELHLSQAVDLVISTCDSLNYMLTLSDFRRAVEKIRRVLKPGGQFGFDLHGPVRAATLKSGLWYDVQDEQVVLYETQVSDVGRIRYDVIAFVSEDGVSYQRFEEHHEQQVFSIQEVEQVLLETGYTLNECVGDFGRTQLSKADRLVFWATAVVDGG